jgi:ABC-type antimicrobial peptide transport system permease subunit
MKLLLLNHIQNARDSLRGNRMRSALTMLGITVGVASITAILALSGGASKIVSDQVDALGGNIAVIRPGYVETDGLDQLSQFSTQQSFITSTLTDNDVETIAVIPNVQTVAPLMVLSGAVQGLTEAPKNTPIVATTPDFEKVSSIKIEEGQFLDDALMLKTVVIGPQLSINTFGTEQSIGKTLKIRGSSFTVIGILKRTNMPVNYNGVDLDNAAIINQESGRELNQGSVQIQQINIQASSVAALDQVIIDGNKALLKNHLNEADFTILSGAEISQPSSQLFTAIAGFTAVIAAISLLVGGVGVMNIMLVNVAERTREIGIRKAVGATNGNIVSQFLIESLFLSIGGGIGGYVLGYIAAFGISTFLTFMPVFTWEIAVAALIVSLVVGTLFGLYPAIRAAGKDPINALKQYD